MATVTVRPSGTDVANGWAAVGGAGTLHGVTSDNSDASYVSGAAATGFSFELLFTNPTIPTGAQVRTVTLRFRVSQTSGSRRFSAQVIDSGDVLASIVTPTSTIQTFTGPAWSSSPQGDAWTTADMATFAATGGLRVVMEALDGLAANNFRVYELYVDVLYNERPVATVTAPAEASTVTNDSQPTVTWTYSDPEGNAQERYRVKVFNAAQYGAGGFDPETSAAYWDSGEVLSAAASKEIGAVLPNDTYRAYVKVADVGSSGRYSTWDFNQFTVSLTPPPVPTLTATADTTLKRVALVARSTGTPAVEFMRFEYSDDGGTTWAAVRGAERVTASAGVDVTVYDYESPPNTARTYRAKAGRAVA